MNDVNWEHSVTLCFSAVSIICEFVPRARPGLKWTCANVLIGSGDPFSTGAAKAFELAASKSQIDVCNKATYTTGSGDMKQAIQQIVGKNCCLVTMVFGQVHDLVSLFLEAQKQGYAGEWLVGQNVISSRDHIVKEMMKSNLTARSVHEFLRGMWPAFAFWKKPANGCPKSCHLGNHEG